MTKSQNVATDAAMLLKARNPLLWIVTSEERRVEKYLFKACELAEYLPRTWDIAAGVCQMNGLPDADFSGTDGDPDAALDAIKDSSGRGVFIMRDLPVWLAPPVGAVTLRRLRNLARWLPEQPRAEAKAVIILSPSAEVPPELANHATVIQWPLPDRDEVAELLDATVKGIAEKLPNAVNGSRDAIIDAAVGLSGEEAQATFAKSLVQFKRIDPKAVAAEKKRVIAREQVLEWLDQLPGGLDAVGGLDNLKSWLVNRAAAYSPKAREYGLPAPKGALLLGVPGCGKTLTAKAIATAWGVPLLKLDLGALRSKYVGESEGNLRKALGVIEAIGRCVVLVDEVEKALAGATGEQGDGGVSADALGALLQWMNDRTGESFIILTANQAEKLPPELTRKGRLDEIWWVDLPTEAERAGVIAAALKSHMEDESRWAGVDLDEVAIATAQFSGAEVAAIVPDAMYTAFADDGREISTDDLLEAAKAVVPMAKSSGEKIAKMREFWSGRARPATSADAAAPVRPVKVSSDARELDF